MHTPFRRIPLLGILLSFHCIILITTHIRSSPQEDTGGETCPRLPSSRTSGAAAKGLSVLPRSPLASALPVCGRKYTTHTHANGCLFFNTHTRHWPKVYCVANEACIVAVITRTANNTNYPIFAITKCTPGNSSGPKYKKTLANIRSTKAT